ncbi:MAG: hypothetical protein L0177_20755, partial [Chloroflexi bacterium]|nr:hypothetical protein [Chloroflexota bacterium]
MTERVELAGAELPIPPNFPVEWESEDERKLLWRWDDIHSPLPATPMSLSIGELSSRGGSRASRELGRADRGLRKRINGYSYSASVPVELTPEQQGQRRRAIEEAIASTRRRWDEEFVPAIERNHAIMRGLGASAASDERLLDFFDEVMRLHEENWYFHTLAVMPMHTAAEDMASLYREIVGDAPDEEPYLLLQGLDNKSLETDRALQALTDEARRHPQVARVFAEGKDPHEIMGKLSRNAQGREFLVKLDEFLKVYGYRPTGFDFIFPTWIEDPSFVILNVKSYLAS